MSKVICKLEKSELDAIRELYEKKRNRQTSGRKKRPPPQRPGFEMAVRDSIRF